MNFLLLDTTDGVDQALGKAEKFLNEFIGWLLAFLPKLISAIVILIVGLFLAKLLSQLIKKAMIKAKLDESVISFFNSLISITLKVIVGITTLSQLGVNMTTIIATLSAATVAIGLALKDSLANVASGALILINKPFKIGDFLCVEGLEGNVTKIEIMYTTIITIDNKQISIPNSKMTSSTIINYTAEEKRRIDLNINISYNQNISEARSIILSVIEKYDNIIRDIEPVVLVGEHADSSIKLIVRVWCLKEDYWKIYFKLLEEIKVAFDENNIEIPFNQVDLHIVEDKTK